MFRVNKQAELYNLARERNSRRKIILWFSKAEIFKFLMSNCDKTLWKRYEKCNNLCVDKKLKPGLEAYTVHGVLVLQNLCNF